MKMKNEMKKQKGFTLVELFIVISIIAILASIAIPSYRRYVMKTERAAAQAKMLEIAGLLENNHLQRGQYEKTFIKQLNDDDAYNVSPNSSNKSYDLLVKALDASNQSFQITATPYAKQKDDKCGTLTIDSLNRKTAKKGINLLTDCW